MIKHVARHWFLLGVALIVALAFAFPGLGELVKDWHVLRVAIFLAFLITGLTFETGVALKEIKNFRAVLASAVSCLFIFPLLAVPLAKLLWPGSTDMIVGMCLLGTAPVSVASGIIMTGIARGNVPLSMFICVATNLVCIFTVPISLKLLLGMEEQIELPILEMIGKLLLTVILPTVIGQLARMKLKAVVFRRRGILSICSRVIVLLIIFSGVSGSVADMRTTGLLVLVLIAFVIVLHAAMLLVNVGISRLLRLDRASTSAFAIQTSQKTITVPSIIWAEYFAGFGLAMIPAIAYQLVQLIMDAAIASRLGKSGRGK